MTLWHAAVPAIAGLLALEFGAARMKGRRVFDGPDTLADVGCAVLSQITGLAVAAITVGGYRLVEQQVAALGWALPIAWQSTTPVIWAGVGQWPDLRHPALASWTGVFLLVDLGQYLIHRLSHRVNLLWACHAVHHSSGELNLAVAIRNSSFHGLFIWIFFLPGAWLGIPWQMVAICYGINVLYQFWIHTRVVDRLGPLERVLNTPSHHRVHHGRDPKYIDRNFGGVLILWDRWFGTFQVEEEEPRYGPPLCGWNPVWANFHGFAQIRAAWRRATTWRGRLLAVVGTPDLLPALPTPNIPPPPTWVTAYVTIQMLVAVGATLHLVLPGSQPPEVRILIGALAVATVSLAGALLDSRVWAWPVEGARLVAVGAVVVMMA